MRRCHSDTAGLREATEDEIEKEGMRRARGAVDNAHLAIFVVDATNAEGAEGVLKRLRKEALAAVADDDGAEGGGQAPVEGGGGRRTIVCVLPYGLCFAGFSRFGSALKEIFVRRKDDTGVL